MAVRLVRRSTHIGRSPNWLFSIVTNMKNSLNLRPNFLTHLHHCGSLFKNVAGECECFSKEQGRCF